MTLRPSVCNTLRKVLRKGIKKSVMLIKLQASTKINIMQKQVFYNPVSYTHLTLPTILLV